MKEKTLTEEVRDAEIETRKFLDSLSREIDSHPGKKKEFYFKRKAVLFKRLLSDLKEKILRSSAGRKSREEALTAFKKMVNDVLLIHKIKNGTFSP